MRTHFKTRRLVLGITATSLFTISGCVDTSAVTKFAASSEVASEKFPAIAADLHKSCVRRKTFDFLAEDAPTTLNPADVRTAAQNACGASKDLESNLVATNTIVTSYIQSLGELSADSAIDYDEQLGQVAESLKKSEKFDDPQIVAGKGLASFLMKAYSDGWRRKKLRDAIGQQNGNLQTVTAVLKTVVKDDYIRSLNLEEQAVRNYYEKSLRSSQPPTRGERHLLVKDWQSDQSEIAKKRQGATAYVGILDRLGKGHQDLYDNRDKLGSKQTRALLSGYGKQLEPLIEQLDEAF